MTAAIDDAGLALARDEAAVTLARDTVTLLGNLATMLGDIAAMLEATAEWADWELAGRTLAPTVIANQMIAALQEIARAARGEAATP